MAQSKMAARAAARKPVKHSSQPRPRGKAFSAWLQWRDAANRLRAARVNMQKAQDAVPPIALLVGEYTAIDGAPKLVTHQLVARTENEIISFVEFLHQRRAIDPATVKASADWKTLKAELFRQFEIADAERTRLLTEIDEPKLVEIAHRALKRWVTAKRRILLLQPGRVATVAKLHLALLDARIGRFGGVSEIERAIAGALGGLLPGLPSPMKIVIKNEIALRKGGAK